MSPWPPGRQQAESWYRRKYWDAMELDQVAYRVAMRLFVMAVNMEGPGERGAAVRCLQEALRRCGFAVAVDGEFGPRTRAAVSPALAANGGDFIARLRAQLALWYVADTMRNPGLRGDLVGFLWRACY